MNKGVATQRLILNIASIVILLVWVIFMLVPCIGKGLDYLKYKCGEDSLQDIHGYLQGNLAENNAHCISGNLFEDYFCLFHVFEDYLDPEQLMSTVFQAVADLLTNLFITKIVFADLILRTLVLVEGDTKCAEIKRAYYHNPHHVISRSWASRR
mmetsp:Transcript_13353/g.20018  ORF Transcript_13353/g.20018 Transcript_13353/m.20018 type:complete len:154 (+) Transcript_13353:222-683(+)